MKWMPPKPHSRFWGPENNWLHRDMFDKWYATEIKPLFENAVEVISFGEQNSWQKFSFMPDYAVYASDGVTGLVVKIEPIKEETAEDILQQLIYAKDHGRIEHLEKAMDNAINFFKTKSTIYSK